MDKLVHDIWVDLHQELKKFILSKVQDVDISNDILQEVFLKIHLNIHTVTNSSKLTAWVYQITRNVVIDYFRESRSYEQIDDLDFAALETDEALYLSLSNCINHKISMLPEKYKQAVILTAFEDYSQIALAEELKITYSGAKTRVQRAREKLKDLIINCTNVESDNKGNITAYQSDQK